MALTESTMLPLGSAAPAFALPEVISNNVIRLDDFRGTTKALLVMFICAHCPYVKHIEQALGAFGKIIKTPAQESSPSAATTSRSIRTTSRNIE